MQYRKIQNVDNLNNIIHIQTFETELKMVGLEMRFFLKLRVMPREKIKKKHFNLF